jgi:hypothetical protein
MPGSIAGENRSAVLQWVIVLGVGALVVTVVLALNLILRLNGGQKVLNAAKPAFASQRLQADVAGINIISHDVDLADPIVTAQGGGAAEIPAVVAYVAKQEKLSPTQALTLMQKTFPHTTALLSAVPLSSVTAELPKLTAFLAPAIPAVPRLVQTITAAPLVTNGWDNVPGTAGTTRFDGAPLRTVPDIQAYFSSDVIPVLETQRRNYDNLVATSNIDFLGPLVLIVGIIVIIYGILMVLLAWRGDGAPEPPAARKLAPVAVGSD